MRAVLDDLASTMRVDPRRIFAMGSSNGAMLTYRLACEFLTGSQPLPSRPEPWRCLTRRVILRVPCRYCIFTDWLTNMRPLTEGPASMNPLVATVSPGNSRLLARRNGCTDEARVSYQQGSATCTTHPDCRSNAEVVLCTIREMGHVWPGYTPEGWPERLLGPGTTDISATDMIVQFFGAPIRCHYGIDGPGAVSSF